MEIISKVDEPTEWCAGMVVVRKPNGKVHICVDLTKPNESILREFHPLPSVDRTLAQLSRATVISKLDANSGFWQNGLSRESAKLTSFITPFAKFCFNSLSIGISSAPEHFQKRIPQVLEGTDGALCIMDDILVYGTSVKEHDENMESTLLKLQDVNLTLKKMCVLQTIRRVSWQHQYQYHIETDHKPLVPLVSTKNLEDLPARVQRFRMQVMRFIYTISHVPGKH